MKCLLGELRKSGKWNWQLTSRGMRGGSHTRRGCVYEGQCILCEEKGHVAKYHGESGRNAYHRINQHVNDINRNNVKNAFVKHIQNNHKEHICDPSIIKFKVKSTFKSCLNRQVMEGVNIAGDDSHELMNSKAEFHQAGIVRATYTKLNCSRESLIKYYHLC